MRLWAVILWLVAGPAFAAGQVTNSEKFQWLETDSPARVEFVRQLNKELNQNLKASSNFRAIDNWVRGRYAGDTVLNELKIDKTHSVSLVYQGLGKPTVVFYNHGAQKEQIYSNYEQGRASASQLIDISLSYGGRFLAIFAAKNGSTDSADVLFYDLHQRQFLSQRFELPNGLNWISGHEAVFYRSGGEAPGYFKYDLEKGTVDPEPGIYPWPALEDYFLYSAQDGSVRLRNGRTGADEATGITAYGSLVGIDPNSIYLLTPGETQNGQIEKFPRGGGVGTVLFPSSNWVLDAAKLVNGGFVLETHYASERHLVQINDRGDYERDILIPDCCSVAGYEWRRESPTADIRLLSAVNLERSFLYDFTAGKWLEDPNALMMVRDGVPYKTEVVWPAGEDGVQIPLRLTYRADLVADGSHGVLMESYGGFGVPGNLDPSYNGGIVTFLQKGGIYAGTGLRGGNEYGEAWHLAAQGHDKKLTFQDLATSARELVRLGWTTPEKIVSMGGSNGGLTVAATALLYPGTFGLVIPWAGVLDMLGKDRLDTAMQGWSYEYGDSAVPDDVPFLQGISPLELASHQGATKFLLVAGLTDSRVNVAHTLKLAAALKEQGGNATSVTAEILKNTGHWGSSPYYQDWIAWRLETVKWTAIYDHLGWRF